MPIPQAIEMSYLEALTQQTLDYQADILLARAYHAGVQPIYLTERQKEYLDLHQDNQFCLNLCRIIVTALTDELNVVGFETGEKENAEGIKQQAEWFWDVWQKNRMDAQQSEIHNRAVAESEAFIILDWDSEGKYPVMVLHERYTSMQASAWEDRWDGLTTSAMEQLTGTDNGVWIVYENDDPNQKAIVGVQRWTEILRSEEGRADPRQRQTLYYPDRIERYFYNGTEWELLEDGVKEWNDKTGKPLGIPVIHFKNIDMRPEAWDAIPINDAANKTWVDILGSADTLGFPMLAVLRMWPTTDGKSPASDGANVWSFGPGEIIGNAQAEDGASITKIEGSDPTPLMETLKDQIMFAANITGTPASRFVTTAQIASDKTLKEQDRQLHKRAINHQILLGQAWADVMVMARRIANAFGNEGMDEKITVKPVWKSLTTIEDLKEEKDLGVPLESIWLKMGKSQAEIAEMKGTTEYRLNLFKAIFEGFTAASQNGMTLDGYLKLIGLSEDEVKEITAAMGSDTIPPTEL